MEAYSNYLANNLKYPKDAVKANASGKVFIEVKIDAKGNLSNLKVLKSPGYGMGEEAVRVIKKSGKWIPAKGKKGNIASTLTLPIQFNLTE
jgi:TonB family protein